MLALGLGASMVGGRTLVGWMVLTYFGLLFSIT